jgi:hypothetical protein
LAARSQQAGAAAGGHPDLDAAFGDSGLSAEAEAWVMQLEDQLRSMEARLRAE